LEGGLDRNFIEIPIYLPSEGFIFKGRLQQDPPLKKLEDVLASITKYIPPFLLANLFGASQMYTHRHTLTLLPSLMLMAPPKPPLLRLNVNSPSTVRKDKRSNMALPKLSVKLLQKSI